MNTLVLFALFAVNVQQFDLFTDNRFQINYSDTIFIGTYSYNKTNIFFEFDPTYTHNNVSYYHTITTLNYEIIQDRTPATIVDKGVIFPSNHTWEFVGKSYYAFPKQLYYINVLPNNILRTFDEIDKIPFEKYFNDRSIKLTNKDRYELIIQLIVASSFIDLEKCQNDYLSLAFIDYDLFYWFCVKYVQINWINYAIDNCYHYRTNCYYSGYLSKLYDNLEITNIMIGNMLKKLK